MSQRHWPDTPVSLSVIRRSTVAVRGAMTHEEALQVFTGNGVALPELLTPSELKAAHQRLAWAHHPDLGGEMEKMQLINIAYDVLRKQMPGRNLRVGDYTNADFFKKSMRHLAGEIGEEWTVLGFDGYYFRSSIAVFSRREFFDLMAEAMLIFQTKGAQASPCRAVFAQNAAEAKILYLIYVDGEYCGDRPIRIEHQSADGDPANDPLFVHSLPRVLDDIRSGSYLKKKHTSAARMGRARHAIMFAAAGIALTVVILIVLLRGS